MAGADPYRAALDGLIEIGMELARMVRDEAARMVRDEAARMVRDEAARMVRDEAGGHAAEATVAFERVSRAVRRTIRMARWLDEPVPARPDRSGAAARVAARKHIIRAVEDRIDGAVDEERAESLHAELLERLDGPDLDDDIAARPVSEIIADIAHDLGLDTWPGAKPQVRRRPADVAALHARAAAAVGATRGVTAPGLRLGRRRGLGRSDQDDPGLAMSGEDLARMLVSAPFRGG